MIFLNFSRKIIRVIQEPVLKRCELEAGWKMPCLLTSWLRVWEIY